MPYTRILIIVSVGLHAQRPSLCLSTIHRHPCFCMHKLLTPRIQLACFRLYSVSHSHQQAWTERQIPADVGHSRSSPTIGADAGMIDLSMSILTNSSWQICKASRRCLSVSVIVVVCSCSCSCIEFPCPNAAIRFVSITSCRIDHAMVVFFQCTNADQQIL